MSEPKLGKHLDRVKADIEAGLCQPLEIARLGIKVQDLTTDLAGARAEIERLRAVLGSVEWVEHKVLGDRCFVPIWKCPVCDRERESDHTDDCDLVGVLINQPKPRAKEQR